MKRVVEAFHVAKNGEKATGLVQIILVVLVIAGTVALTKVLRVSADTGPGFTASQAGLVVDVIKPAAQTHTATRRLTGEVTARATVTISPQVNGRVISVNDKLQPGGDFAPGEVLFEIDPEDFELALQTAEAEVAAAEADLLQTKATAENFVADWYRVFPDREPPQLVAREPQVKAAEARLKAAEAQVGQARLNLARTRYTVDYPARIIDSSVERGQFVGALLGGNASYGSLYATDTLRITASIQPEDLARLELQQGDSVTIKSALDASDLLTAPIAEVGGVLDSRTRLRELTIALPGDTALVPGTFVKVQVSGEPMTSIYRLPIGALATADSVWTVSGKNLVQQAVEVVDLTNDHVFVRAFDVADGVVVTEVPTSFIEREVSIRRTLAAAGDAS